MVKYRLVPMAQSAEEFAKRMRDRRDGTPEPVFTTNAAMKDWIVLRVGEGRSPREIRQMTRQLIELLGSRKVLVLPHDIEFMVFEEMK